MDNSNPAEPVEVSGTEGGRMPLIEHLKELRSRLIISLIALAIAFAVAFSVSDYLFAALCWPLREVSHGRVMLIGTGVGEAFFTKIKVALIAGLFMASPAIFYEIWKFIAPGLFERERRLVAPFVICASLFFILGGYFCYAVVFKVGFAFFIEQYATIGVTPTIRISEYLAFSAKLLLAFGITFEMPTFAFFLTRLGTIDYRMMLRSFRYAVIVIFVVAAVLAPPDAVSMFLLATPLLALYGLSVAVSYIFRARPEAPQVIVAPGSETP